MQSDTASSTQPSARQQAASERVVPVGVALREAEALAHEIAQFPQACVRADRKSVYLQHGLSVRQAMQREWGNGIAVLEAEGVHGAARFAKGIGRHGDFSKLEG
jgi:enoyl-CoA hydratase